MVLHFRYEIVVSLGMVDAATVTVLEPKKPWPFIPCLYQEDSSWNYDHENFQIPVFLY